MPLTNIEYGSLASSEVMNDNFEYLDNRITTVAGNLTSTASTINSSIASMNSTFTQQNESLMSDISDLEDYAQAIRNDLDSLKITPDYVNGIGISFPYTATENGYIKVVGATSNNDLKVYVNSVEVVYLTGWSYGGATNRVTNMFNVSKNDYITITGTGLESAVFFPLKEAD